MAKMRCNITTKQQNVCKFCGNWAVMGMKVKVAGSEWYRGIGSDNYGNGTEVGPAGAGWEWEKTYWSHAKIYYRLTLYRLEQLHSTLVTNEIHERC